MWQPQVRSVSVMDTAHAWLMTDALRDVVRHGTAVGSVGARINFPAGGKTGTTNDGFDVWFIGFTPDLVTGVWIGFDQPRKIKANAQGGVLAAPAWTAMMREVYERRAHPRGLAAARRAHRARHRQDHRLQGDAVLSQGRPLHRVVHSRDRAHGLLSDPLAVRRGGRRGGAAGTGTAPDGAPQPTAPLPPGVASGDAGAGRAAGRRPRRARHGRHGGRGPAPNPQR